MPRVTSIDIIDAWWAARLGCSIDDLRAPRTLVLAHGEQMRAYRGVYGLAGQARGAPPAAGCIISAPEHMVARLRDRLERLSPAAAFDSGRLVAVLGAGVDRVIGPASLSYADEGDLRGKTLDSAGARKLTDEDHAALRRLHDACDPVEWDHGGIDVGSEPIFGAIRNGQIVAAASWEDWGEIRHIGVIAHPAHRGQGHGRAVAAAITAAAIEQGFIAQWQTLLANTPSHAIGRSLGYVERFRSIAIRLRLD